ncbi:hypothetical protein SAMN04487982_110167 [Streptomyces sp. ok210]|nr:hypothetical protein SAMN04487982_110167 [Streptomyces sp. ok210]
MPGTPDEPDFSGLEGGEEQAAEDAVQEVVNWYNAQIVTEQRRAPVPNEERIEALKAGREAALADQADQPSVSVSSVGAFAFFSTNAHSPFGAEYGVPGGTVSHKEPSSAMRSIPCA